MIRQAIATDIDRVVDIYNQAVAARFQTCFTQPFTIEERRQWFALHLSTAYPIWVYEHEGEVAGWLAAGPYREGRGALQSAIEISYFIDTAFQLQGIGSMLMQHALEMCAALGYKTALAILLEGNTGSIKLLERFGFERWGYLPEVADFDGIARGQLYYGRKL